MQWLFARRPQHESRGGTQEPEGISESEAETVEERSRLTPFSKVTVGANPGPSWHILGTGDFGGDGDADLLWQNNNGQAAIWLMSGTAQTPKGWSAAIRAQPGTSTPPPDRRARLPAEVGAARHSWSGHGRGKPRRLRPADIRQ
jgi:hypothetical protein